MTLSRPCPVLLSDSDGWLQEPVQLLVVRAHRHARHVRREQGRGLHSFPFPLNLSALSGIGGARRIV